MAKPPRPPVNTPAPGDRVKMRGRDARGTLSRVNHLNWALVAWDDGATGPKVVHLFELEKLPPST